MTPRSDEPEPIDPAEFLVPLVRDATVGVHGATPGHPLYGSGFFVAPNWVLTCAHVACRSSEDAEGAAGVGQPAARAVTVGWGGRMLDGVVEWAQPAEHDGGSWPAPDLALIRLLDPVDHPCVWLTERTAKAYTTNQVAFFGYTAAEAGPESYNGRCTISGQVGIGGVLKLGNEDEMPHGVSGGPVVDLVRGEVIGVLKARRRGQDGGQAVGIQQLRRLPAGDPADPSLDLYHRVMTAHDLYHADRHAFVRDDGGTWTDAHSEIGACAGRALTPGQRTRLLGLLAELPPPVDANSLKGVVEAVRGGPAQGLTVAPRGWRDGLGLLYDLRRGTAELEAVLRYAVHAATADRVTAADESAERTLWEWAQQTAADAEDTLGKLFRRTLVDERRSRLRVRAAPGADRVPAEQHGTEALLQISPRGWEPGRYDWRVSVVPRSGEVECVEEQFDPGTDLEALAPRLREPLREVFRRCDGPGTLAVIQLAVPGALVGRFSDVRLLGIEADRPVVIRRTDMPDEDRPEADERAARWRTLHEQPPRTHILDCDEGAACPLPDEADLRARPRDTLPALCRSAATAPEALDRIVRGGYSVALWRRRPVAQESVCADFHRGMGRAVRDARSAGRLPRLLVELRAEVDDGVPEKFWASGLMLFYDDPTRPLPGTDEPLETP
ncbi:VMAP-C domain-containing protein [Actinacidiphila paucisporea]|uniref:Trypsin-like peptidase domain-containing protein n=1 Tax=Actinacidiphila paucisporea TaxID=310782 RepID=A0A1M6V6J1_9ACTN|nr:trypsin-like peptidase domain-containing protein [Actinacidiphila paucisporea]SHK77097.1 Trypsin-like peptidase domain-containing protein [Actinacidiphila paucisporea]